MNRQLGLFDPPARQVGPDAAWLAQAEAAVRWCAQRCRTFTQVEVRARLDECGVVSRYALGRTLARAVRSGIVTAEPSGSVWRSRVYQREA